MSIEAYHIVKSPIITEESQIQSSKGPQYTFRVVASANKHQIREAIEEIFPDVKVRRVNTMNCKGKKGQRSNRGVQGTKSKWKKAIVTLRDGDTIELI